MTHPAISYLKALFLPTDRICFTFIDQVTKVTEHEFISASKINEGLMVALERKAAAGKNVYVCMNPIKADVKSRTKDSIAAIRTAYIDVDAEGPICVDNVLADAMAGDIPEPQFILESSPGKRQIVWLLSEGVSLERQEALNKALVLRYGGDLACTDAPRVFRLPGFPNHKYEARPIATVLESGDGSRHKFSAFKIDVDMEKIASARPPADDEALRYTADKAEANMREANIEHGPMREWRGQGYIWDLNACPWAAEHSTGPGGAIAILHSSGALDFNCLHGHSLAKGGPREYKWQDFKTFAETAIGHKVNWGAPRDWADMVDMDQYDLSAGIVDANGNPRFVRGSSPATAVVTKAAINPSEWRQLFRSINELEDGDVRFLVKDFLPEGIIYFGALPGHGKSWLALSLSKALVTGDPFLGKYEVLEKTPVIYMIPEASSRAFKFRAKKFNIPDDEKMFLCRTLSEGVVIPLTDERLLSAVKELKPVIILDTMIRFSDADDENAAAQTRALDAAMVALRAAGSPCILCLHHASKTFATGDITLENCLRGSSAIGAICDTVWALRRNESLYDNGAGPEEIKVVNVKPRDFAEQPKPITLALRYRKSDETLASCLDEFNDFQLVEDTVVQHELDSRFSNAILRDPNISLRDLEIELGIGVKRIRNMATRLRCKKPSGKPWITGVTNDSKKMVDTRKPPVQELSSGGSPCPQYELDSMSENPSKEESQS